MLLMQKQRNGMLFFFFILAICLLHNVNIYAAQVTLGWNQSTGNNLAGYNLHYGTNENNYDRKIDVGDFTTHTVLGLSEGTKYFFAVTAYDLTSNESDFSDSVSVVIPDTTTTTTDTQTGSFKFFDDFSSDRTGNYKVADGNTKGGFGSFLYDSKGTRGQVLTGDNISLIVSHSLPELNSGTFEIEFLPTTRYPKGGELKLLLKRDNKNYYELSNSDGYGPYKITKVINGNVVDSANFIDEYSQGSNHKIKIHFSPEETMVSAFGELLTLTSNTNGINVASFELELHQQDAFIDNIIYTDEINFPSGSEHPTNNIIFDDFSNNTTTDYTVTNIITDGGVGSFLYDSDGKRGQVRTGDNISLQISRNLPELNNATFGIEFLPTTKYPKGSKFKLRLKRDNKNYYELSNSDGYGALKMKKVAGGSEVESEFFQDEYTQGIPYDITMNISANQTIVDAFGEMFVLNTNTNNIVANKLEIELEQQDAFLDNIIYTNDIKVFNQTLFKDGSSTIDNFKTDTTDRYSVVGKGSLVYDSNGERAQVLTGDNITLKFSDSLPNTIDGTFSIDFLPTVNYPKGGRISLRLIQDSQNYYEIANTDGYGPLMVKKVVKGIVVDSLPFQKEYAQNKNHQIAINFKAEVAIVGAFEEVLVINKNTDSILVKKFEIELSQQDAFFDNIKFE